MRYCVSALLLSALVVATAPADMIVDQVSLNTDAGFGLSGSNFQQDVVVGVAGLLSQVDVYVRSGVGGNATIYVQAGAPWISTPPTFTYALSVTTAGWVSIDTTAAGLSFEVGDHLVIGAMPPTSGTIATLGGSNLLPEGAYAPGRLYNNGGLAFSSPKYDMAFQTYMTPVPEPGMLALLGFAGLASLRRR